MNIVLIALAVLVVLALGYVIRGAVITRVLTKKAEEAVPRVGALQKVEGGVIHYLDMGPRDAQTIVLIHGISAQLQHYTYGVSDLLKDRFRVVVIDRPGCGYSERDGMARAEFSAQGAMIREFLGKIGVERPILAGHSLGGAVSLAMALDAPDEVAALALICPFTHHPGDAPSVFRGLEVRTAWLRSLLAHTIAVPLALKNAQKVLRIVFKPEAYPEDFLERGGGMLGLRPKAFRTASEELVTGEWAISDLSARYHELSVGGAVLYGADDALLDPAVHGAPMAEYGLRYVKLEGGGHMIPITQPQACADFIADVSQAAQKNAAE